MSETTAVEPVWKKYAHPRRNWTEQDRIAHALAKEYHHRVVEAAMVDGLSWRQAGKNFELPENVVGRIVRRWKKQARALAYKRNILSQADWANHITDKGKEKLLEAVEAPNGITTEEYNQVKIIQTHFKGTGIYKLGDSITLNQQNNFYSEEQAARILDLERKAKSTTIIETTAEPALDGGAAGNFGADQERPALVAAECD